MALHARWNNWRAHQRDERANRPPFVATRLFLLESGGDPDKFKEINEAYDVLKDPKKREIYDQVGRRSGRLPFRPPALGAGW